MLKNKFKIITILSVIILLLTLPVVRAENETAEDAIAVDDEITAEDVDNDTAEDFSEDTDENISLISESGSPNEESTSTPIMNDENFKSKDVYLVDQDVTIDYIVDGNLFVIANNVTINSQIGGDAFIFANTVTIGEQAYIFSNLFTCAQNVNINGVVYDVYSASTNTTIKGYVYRDVHIASNGVDILGNIGRNAYIGCANLNFGQKNDVENEEETTATSQGSINGNLNYTSKQEASIPEGSVSGEVAFNQEIETDVEDNNIIQEKILSLGTFVVTIIVIWLICQWLAPKFLKNSPSLLTTKKILPVIGFGILTPIVGILLSILLLIVGITSTLAILLFTILIILMLVSKSIFVITINNIICDKLKIQKTSGIFGILVACGVVLWLIGLIPFIGSLIKMIAVILGLGIILSSLILKEKDLKKDAE